MIYSNITQSAILESILPISTADLCYINHSINDAFERLPMIIGDIPIEELEEKYKVLPCWSFSRLLELLPKGEEIETDLCFGGYDSNKYIAEWFCTVIINDNMIITCNEDKFNAVYDMILELNTRSLI